MFFFPFLCSGIPDVVIGILKMLIYVFVMYYNQQSNNLFLGYDFQPVCTVMYSMYGKCLPFTSISHIQKVFESHKQNQS